MAECCNNECLEMLNTNCIDYGGEPLLSSTSTQLTQIIQDLDALISDPQINIGAKMVTVDLKCLGSNCTGLPEQSVNWSFISTPAGGAMNITVSFPPGSFIFEYAKAYTGGNQISEITTYGTLLSVGSDAITSGFIVTLSLLYNSPGGTVHYTGTIVIPPGMLGINNGSTVLTCLNSTISTLAISSLFQILINKVC